MTELLSNIAMGLQVALTVTNVFYCLVGAIIGTIIGVLPGIGPVSTIAILLPITFSLPTVTALIMLAGIYYGASYGGSTTAILVNLPGETSSVVTCLDGYAMAQSGKAGVALTVSAVGSFVAGCIATVIIACFAPPLATLALKFQAPEYCSLMLLGLMSAAVLARGSLLKAIAMIFLGLLLGLVGTDVNSGILRFDYGVQELYDGISFVAVAMGLFGFGEIIVNLESTKIRRVFRTNWKSLLPSREEIRLAWKAVVRGTFLGSILGILPGGGPTLGAFTSYTLEKSIAKDKSRFGKGAIEGVAGPESANNAAAQTSFIPLLTLGIPSNAVLALMIGAMMIHGIVPGPRVMNDQPQLFWGIIASMWVGNLILVILNLPLIGVWVKFLSIPYRLLFPGIVVFICIGAYAVSGSPVDVALTAGFGLLGYIFIKLDCEPAPLLLGFILGPIMEENLRRAMLLSRGDPTIFFKRPISLCLLVLTCVMLVLVVVPSVKRKRQEAFKDSA